MNSATTGEPAPSQVVGIRDLRDSLSRHLASVRAGVEITVTDHGRPVARIVPAGDEAYQRLVDSGRLRLPERPDAALPRRRSGAQISDLIER